MRKKLSWADHVRWVGGAPLRWWGYRKAYQLAVASDGWSAEQITEYHNRALVSIVRHAARRVPFYRRLYAEAGVDVENFSGIDDLPKLPIITREDVRKHGRTMCVEGVPRWLTCSYNTGGTTAGLVAAMYAYRGVAATEAGYIDALWRRVGARGADRMALLRGELSHEAGVLWDFDRRTNRLILSSYKLTVERAREYLALMKRYQVQWLHAYPSSAWLLATLLEDAGIPFDVPIRGVLLGSETVHLAQCEVFRRVFRCPVYAHYGHRELALLAGWCEGSTDYHFLPTHGYVEFRPAELTQAAGPPVYELIATGYINRYMPLIRYATQDFAEPAPPGACPACGRAHVRVKMMYGRGQNFLVSENGTILPYTSLEFHSYHRATRYQFRQDEPGRVVFRFVPVDPERASEHARQLEQEFTRLKHLGLTVSVEIADDLPRTWSGKDIVVVQNLPLPWSRAAPGGDGTSRASSPRTLSHS